MGIAANTSTSPIIVRVKNSLPKLFSNSAAPNAPIISRIPAASITPAIICRFAMRTSHQSFSAIIYLAHELDRIAEPVDKALAALYSSVTCYGVK